MQKGVDISQIRRIRQKYERQLKNGGLGIVADESVSKAENTLRKNNGDAKKGTRLAKNKSRDNKKSSNYTSNKYSSNSNGNLNQMDVDADDEEYKAIRTELQGFGFEADVDTAALSLPSFENSQLTEDLKENPEKTYSTDYSLNIKKQSTDYDLVEKTFKQKESTSNNKAVKLSQLLPVRYLTLYNYSSIEDLVQEVKDLTDS